MKRFTVALFMLAVLAGSFGAVWAQDDDTPEPCSAIQLPEMGEPEDLSGGELRPLTLFLGYIPNVQFAPLYVAAAKGYFAEAGVDVRFEYGDENIGLERIAAGELQFGVMGGEQVVLARARELPVVYVFEWYQRFAVGVVAPVDKGIVAPEDMAGRVIGIPGRYGASWTGFVALLNAVGMTEADLGGIEPIGFAATEAICAGRVDASVVYVSNEPEQIRKACSEVNVIPVADYADLVANGLVTGETTLAEEPELVRGMVWAFARGLADAIADPQEAYELSRAYVEALDEDDPLQHKVLENSIALWEADQIGYTDPASWTFTMQTLVDMDLLDAPTDLSGACTNVFLPPMEADE
ncbi:MAG: ABC transporter substrate-binding protein [Anaerolineae bacterium]|nr:ABC transporter substrate-binding protein [Anaerolineae bacterium]